MTLVGSQLKCFNLIPEPEDYSSQLLMTVQDILFAYFPAADNVKLEFPPWGCKTNFIFVWRDFEGIEFKVIGTYQISIFWSSSSNGCLCQFGGVQTSLKASLRYFICNIGSDIRKEMDASLASTTKVFIWEIHRGYSKLPWKGCMFGALYQKWSSVCTIKREN